MKFPKKKQYFIKKIAEKILVKKLIRGKKIDKILIVKNNETKSITEIKLKLKAKTILLKNLTKELTKNLWK